MPLWNSIQTSWALNWVRHSVLVFSLIMLMILTAVFTGYFARGQATTFLCQYDPDALSKCATILDDPSLANPKPLQSPIGSPELPQSANKPNAIPSAGSSSVSDEQSSPPTKEVNNPNQAAERPIELTNAQKERISAQAYRLKSLVGHHGKVMILFYEAYYQALSVVLLMGVIAAMALFSVAQDGWNSASPYVKTVFVVATAGVAFFGLWPPVFEQEKNITDNKALFLEYERLRNEIASYPVTHHNPQNETVEPSVFINYIDSEMHRLGNIAIGFDYTKISYKGAFDLNAGALAETPSPPPKKK